MSKNRFTFEVASEEDLKNLEEGANILVNLEEPFTDIAIFLEYDKTNKKIVCYDCGIRDATELNTMEYDECIILPKTDLILKKYRLENLERV